jgi:hypothetical protein
MQKSIKQLFVVSILVFAGCATVITGTKQEMTFNSNPDGATVSVNGREVGKTPMVMQLERGDSKPLTFSKVGYQTESVQIESELNPWFWGNIVFYGGFFSSTTDAVAGGIHKYSPSQYMVTLIPIGSGASAIESQLGLTEKQKIKDFIVVSYRQLGNDVAKGHGEYLTSLFSMLNISGDGAAAGLNKLRALHEAYPNIPEFAERTLDLYREKSTGKPDSLKNEQGK